MSFNLKPKRFKGKEDEKKYDFVRVLRKPRQKIIEDKESRVKFVNVYNSSSDISFAQSKVFSNTFQTKLSHEVETPIKQHKTFTGHSPSVTYKSFKILPKANGKEHLEVPVKRRETPKAAQKITIDHLTSLSQKESIIFNQVKNLIVPKAKPQSLPPIVSETPLSRMRTGKVKFARMSTMKKAQTEDESNFQSENTKVEEIPNLQNEKVEKRKPLKLKAWKWVGAGGEIVY